VGKSGLDIAERLHYRPSKRRRWPEGLLSAERNQSGRKADLRWRHRVGFFIWRAGSRMAPPRATQKTQAGMSQERSRRFIVIENRPRLGMRLNKRDCLNLITFDLAVKGRS
jgi:hypothetical protein